jgi:ABC-type branched-subunit amino acid transport system substrate-binding protein
MGMRRRSNVVRGAVLVLAVAVTGACGARVSDQQVRASLGAADASQSPTAAADDSSTPAPEAAGDAPAQAEAPTAAAPGAAAGPEPAVGAAAGARRMASDVGITPDTMTIGHVTQLSGPVPGLFEGSVRGINAYAAYANSKGGLAGRKLVVETRDDQFDAAQNRVVTNDLLAKTFALIGGVSLYDDASAADVGRSGAPDIPGLTLNKVRGDLPNNFAIVPNVDGAPTSHFLWFQRKFPDAVKSIGSIYGDVPSAKRAHENQRKAAESIGYVWKYDRGYQATETDFTADVIRMRQSGVKAVFLVALDAKNVARVLKAAAQQSWKPDVWILGASAYDRALLVLAGPAAEGITIFSTAALYAGEDAGVIPEVKLFNEWYQKANPGKTPDFYGVSAWMSGMLFAQAVEKAGPNPTRASVVAALRTITTFTGNGMQGETSPAQKRPTTCYLIMKVEGGKFKRVDPADKGFRCEGEILRR